MVFLRAKYDAWHGLGNTDRNAAMNQYVENLNKIIETMKFSADVEHFMDVLGPFYEEVENEDEQTVANSNPPSVRGLMKKPSDMNHLSAIEEDASINDCLGRYDSSDSNLTDETEDSEFLTGNSSQLRDNFLSSRRGQSLSGLVDVDDETSPCQLFEELKFAKESLEEAKSVMNGVTLENSGKLSQVEIERMLGNIDGFIPRPGGSAEQPQSPLSSPSCPSSDSEDSEEDLFEDSLETFSPVRSPPPAPQHGRQERLPSLQLLKEEEEEEMLVVTTEQGTADISENVNLQLELTVARMKGDMDHLQARVQSVETILVLRGDNQARPALDWWPFEDLAPKTVLFMVSWPLISHGLLHLAKLAFRKSRK